MFVFKYSLRQITRKTYVQGAILVTGKYIYIIMFIHNIDFTSTWFPGSSPGMTKVFKVLMFIIILSLRINKETMTPLFFTIHKRKTCHPGDCPRNPGYYCKETKCPHTRHKNMSSRGSTPGTRLSYRFIPTDECHRINHASQDYIFLSNLFSNCVSILSNAFHGVSPYLHHQIFQHIPIS